MTHEWRKILVEHILGDPGADSGGKGKPKRVEKMARRKVKNSPPFPPPPRFYFPCPWVSEAGLKISYMLLGRSFKTGPTMYKKKKQTNKNEKSKDYCKADSEERVLFFITIFISIYPCAWHSGLRYDHHFINKRMLALEKPV